MKFKQAILSGCLGLVALWSCTSIVAADDASRTVILEGPVRNIDWSGKQLRFTMGSYDGHGGAPEWIVLGPAPEELFKIGWSKTSIKVGDVLDVVVHPAADDSRNGQLMRIIFRDASTLEISARGTTHIVPHEAFTRTTTPKGDPLQGYYGNTVVFKGKNYEGHAWFNADNTVTMFNRDQQADGTWTMRVVMGTYWLQRLQDKYIKCFFFERSTLGPFCHSPVDFEQPGDKWEIKMPSGDSEMREIVVGHQ
ncbi:MAG: DUF6152 family protein [Steroidobacteraceae bacterium]